MNRASKGFGLAGVVVAVIFLAVTAIISASASAADIQQPPPEHSQT